MDLTHKLQHAAVLASQLSLDKDLDMDAHIYVRPYGYLLTIASPIGNKVARITQIHHWDTVELSLGNVLVEALHQMVAELRAKAKAAAQPIQPVGYES